MKLNKKVELMDTTLRDGEQTPGVSFNSEEKLILAKMLFDLGVDRIEISSAKAVKEDEIAIQNICNYANSIGRLKDVEVLGFIDKKSVDWIYNNGCRTVNLLAKGSASHCNGQLGKECSEHVNNVCDVVDYASSLDMDVNVYLEDWSRGMKESREHVYNMVESLVDVGVIRVMLPDTLGVLSYWEVEEFISELVDAFDVHLDFHAHNDYDLSTANSLAAIKGGVDGIHVTLNRLGERTGNACLYPVAVSAKDMLDYDFGLLEENFNRISMFVERISRRRMGYWESIVGKGSKTTTASVHANGDEKGDLYIDKLTAERFGFFHAEYALGKHAGKSSIKMNLKQMGLELEDKIVDKLVEKVRDLGENKDDITQEDLYFLLIPLLEEDKVRPFKYLEASANVNLSGSKFGYVKVEFDGKVYERSAVGNGGYDAIMNATRLIFMDLDIDLPALLDYNSIIPPGGKTDAIVQTDIDWKNGGNKPIRTVGVDTDQTISGVRATEKMINFYLMKLNN
ncbi:alpha-isopropylmalate synthase regulatory domain-containing protein [Nanoarchaeota archaeon]